MNEINEDANDLMYCSIILGSIYGTPLQKAEKALKTFNKKYLDI